MGPGLTLKQYWKIVPNLSYYYGYLRIVYHVYFIYLIKSCCHYDLSVPSMSVMDFPKKVLIGGWVPGWALSTFFV